MMQTAMGIVAAGVAAGAVTLGVALFAPGDRMEDRAAPSPSPPTAAGPVGAETPPAEVAKEEKKETCDLDNLPAIIFDESVGDWVVDRFAGNSAAGRRTYGGPSLEVGGLQRANWAVGTPDGATYLLYGLQTRKVKSLARVAPDGHLSLFMAPDGIISGPLAECQAGFPVWNPADKCLYLTGPNCLRKITANADGTHTVSVVAGQPNVSGTADGPAFQATLLDAQPYGVVCDSKGTFYWLAAADMARCLRRIRDGTVSTIPLRYADEQEGKVLGFSYDTGVLSLGENDDTLYVNYYCSSKSSGVYRCDLRTGVLTRVHGFSPRTWKDPRLTELARARMKLPGARSGELDGPALTHASSATYKGLYDPFYDALWVFGADHVRVRWLKPPNGNGWVRTVLGARRPGTPPPTDGFLKRANSTNVPGEHWPVCVNVANAGLGPNGSVFLVDSGDHSGFWRACDAKKAGARPPAAGAQEQAPAPTSPKGSRIYAARAGTDGKLIAKGYEIAPSKAGAQEYARVAFFGGVFLVVWQDMRNGRDCDVLGARVSADGKVLDAEPLAIAAGPRTQALPDVDADNQGFVVVWQGFSGNDMFPKVSARRVNADGAMGGIVTLNLDTREAAHASMPRIAWNGTEYLIVYSGLGNGGGSVASGTVSWARLNTRLQVQGSPRFYCWASSVLAVAPAADPAKGWNAIHHTCEPDPWFHSQAYVRNIAISPQGEPAATPPPGRGDRPASFIPANWADAMTVKGINDGTAPHGEMAIARDATYTVMAWQRYHRNGIRMENPDIRVTRLDGWNIVDTPGVGVPAAESAADELHPALAGNGAGIMLLLYEKRAAGRAAIAARLLTIGDSIKVGDEVIVGPDDGPGGGRRAFPAVAYGSGDPKGFLVVWQEGWHGEH
ncbi:MAG: hypothetical protein N3A38_14175, partial [Planctomycetota bacterium]|nr:hypothetical protein [Planctomycetota bacterium]